MAFVPRKAYIRYARRQQREALFNTPIEIFIMGTDLESRTTFAARAYGSDYTNHFVVTGSLPLVPLADPDGAVWASQPHPEPVLHPADEFASLVSGE